MAKFKVGDKVRFLKDHAFPFGKWVDVVDCDKVYEVVDVNPLGIDNAYRIDCGYGFIFEEEWLAPADASEVKVSLRIKNMGIKNVIFNPPATIVFWTDGTKTVVKCGKGERWDAEKGLAMACAKKLLGNEGGYHKEISKYTENAIDINLLRNKAYKLCGSVMCKTCPSKDLFGECPNFLRLGASDLNKLVHAMLGAKKYGDS